MTKYSERPGTWQWSSVQAIEAMAPATAWPSLRIMAEDQSVSDAAPNNFGNLKKKQKTIRS
jgi:hypothetical protein